MARRWVCSKCSRPFETLTKTGPLPSVCDTCDPERARERELHREMNRNNARRRRETMAKQAARIVELEAQLAFRQESLKAKVLLVGSKAEVAAAVGRVAKATGRKDTRDALLALAGACEAWAGRLATTYEYGDEHKAAA